MSIGIRLHDMAPGTLSQRAQIAKNQGFKCVHLALSKTISPSYMQPAAATSGLASYVRDALDGLDVAVLGCYLNLATPDEAEYTASLEKYIAHLRLAGWLGAGVVGTETGNPNVGYRYDPVNSHTEDSLQLFIDRLRPVVAAAEKLGQTIAIEPVFKHIVSDGKRARKVLDAISSPNLRIILDPVNLLHESNLNRRDEIIAEAVELLGKEIQILHLKDYVLEDGRMIACACGAGLMDYSGVMPYIRGYKPHIHITLENTKPENAEAARLFTENMLKSE